MKTIEEVKAYKLKALQNMLKWPSMCINDELPLISFICDLTFIDDDMRDWPTEQRRLMAQRRFISTGVRGALEQLQIPRPPKRLRHFPAEIASVYAEVFWRLDYLALDRNLSPATYNALHASLDRFRTGEWHQDYVVQVLGPPSLIVGKHILCYAGEDKEAPWLYFDFEFCWQGYADDTELNQPSVLDIIPKRLRDHPDERNPLLRDVRFQGVSSPEMVITEYGQRIRSNFVRS